MCSNLSRQSRIGRLKEVSRSSFLNLAVKIVKIGLHLPKLSFKNKNGLLFLRNDAFCHFQALVTQSLVTADNIIVVTYMCLFAILARRN